MVSATGAMAVLAGVLLFVVIVGGSSALQAQASCALTTGAGGTVPVEAGQTAYVRTIIGVGKARNASAKGWIVALAVALQESGLRNLSNPTYPQSLSMTRDGSGTDHDSLGLFQQRPQSGWGSVAQLMDPTYEATAFFGGPDVPPANPGLLDIPGWQSLPVTVAAQQVQVSAYPDAYAKWEGEATQLAAANADAPPVAVLNPPPGSPAVASVGYTGADGLCGPGGLPRTAAEQYAATAGRTVETGSPELSRLQPGDLLFWGSSAGSVHHVALYVGGARMLEEAHPGTVARLIGVYGGDFYAATRPLAKVPVAP